MYWAYQIPIWSPDEGRFAEIAREMWLSKDFVVPHFNFVPHFEKPVFAFLLTALSMGFWGATGFGARFPGVLAALGGILASYYFTRKLFDKKTAQLSAIILATTTGYFLVGRFAMIDMVLTFLLSVSFYCLALAKLKQKPNLYLGAYFFMGLAFLTKGLIGIVLPGLGFLSYLVWAGEVGELKRMKLGWGLLIIAVLFIPWGIAISIREPEFSYTFITQQQFSRFATGHFGRSRPFWFFIPIFLALTFPWSFFFPKAALSAVRRRDGLGKDVSRFLLCWLGTILIFFSIPRSKLPYYIVPVAPPAAILVALWLSDIFYGTHEDSNKRRKQFGQMVKFLGWVSFAALAGLNIYLFVWGQNDVRAKLFTALLPIGTACLSAGMWITGRYLKKNNYDATLLSMAAMIFIAFHFMGIGMQTLSPYFSTAYEAQILRSELKKEDVVSVYASPDHFSDLPFHLARRIVIVGSDRGTLTNEVEENDLEENAKEWFPSASEFLRLFNSRQKRIFCLLEEKKLDELKMIGLSEVKTFWSGYGKTIITNQDY